MDKDTNINYRYSLPNNKLFDYIHTHTAVVCTPLVEIKRIVEHYQVGEVLEQLTPQILAQKINSLLENPVLLKHYQDNCLAAKEQLNWQNETAVLKQIYVEEIDSKRNKN
ncbi:MAG: hypothetical protein R2779_02615 [Crocinitomicaceae bacterium]